MSTDLIVNSTLPETRIALLEDGEIQELHIERDSDRGIVGNIYKGKVIRVLPGMQAAFVDIGLEKAAFLYVDDIFFPDMKTPLVTNPLPSAPTEIVAPRVGHTRGRPKGVKPTKGPAAIIARPTVGPTLMGTPEDHANLQREYGRQMLDIDEEATEEVLPKKVETSQPETETVTEKEVYSSVAEPEISEDEVESAAIYRPEPEIDPQAWVEDVVKDVALDSNPTDLESNPVSDGDIVPGTSGIEALPVAGLVKITPQVAAPAAQNDDDDDDDGEGVIHRRPRRGEHLNIADLVKEGQEILVQVAKEPIGTKGARLTCHVSLPGRYLVFMPTVDHVGVSRRIESDIERRRLKDTISRIRPSKTGVIVRTASGKQSDESLRSDLDYLVQGWNEIQKKFIKQKTPSIVYQDLTIVLRAIRDMVTPHVDRIIVDSKREHKSVMKFVSRFITDLKDKVELYSESVPIFDYYGIENEIQRSLDRRVWLKSGGYIVIDQAEALVAIDVNTGRYVGKKNLEETILKTNLEAVKEIAYQLRIRNYGGIIILDLIDMEKDSHKEKVYRALEEALRKDRARPTILKISQLGLVEMTRKRTRDSIVRSLCEPCTSCEGKGYVKNKKTIAFDIMRDIEREAFSNETSGFSVQCHPSVADVLLEEKRDVLENLEHQYNKNISVRANGAYHIEQYELVLNRGEGKNVVFSSEERRAKIRKNIQEQIESQMNAEDKPTKKSSRGDDSIDVTGETSTEPTTETRYPTTRHRRTKRPPPRGGRGEKFNARRTDSKRTKGAPLRGGSVKLPVPKVVETEKNVEIESTLGDSTSESLESTSILNSDQRVSADDHATGAIIRSEKYGDQRVSEDRSEKYGDQQQVQSEVSEIREETLDTQTPKVSSVKIVIPKPKVPSVLDDIDPEDLQPPGLGEDPSVGFGGAYPRRPHNPRGHTNQRRTPRDRSHHGARRSTTGRLGYTATAADSTALTSHTLRAHQPRRQGRPGHVRSYAGAMDRQPSHRSNNPGDRPRRGTPQNRGARWSGRPRQGAVDGSRRNWSQNRTASDLPREVAADVTPDKVYVDQRERLEQQLLERERIDRELERQERLERQSSGTGDSGDNET